MNGTNNTNNTCLGIPSAVNTLRMDAKRLHEKAVNMDKLADFIEHAPSEVEQAIFDLILMSRKEL